MPSFGIYPETSSSETQDGPLPAPQCAPEDVHMYTSPWVSETRASAYYGPVTGDAFCVDRNWDLAIESALASIRNAAATLGGNSIVGIELFLDPFAEPPYVHAVGTAATLVPLF